MEYIEKVIGYLVSYDVFVLPALVAAVWCIGIVNWCHNVYRKQNGKFIKCRRNLLKNPNLAGMYLSDIPVEYRRQWRAYYNGGVQRPSLVFEFVPRKNRFVGGFWLALTTAVSACYLAIFLLDNSRREYAIFQGVYILSIVVVCMINGILFKKKEKVARRHFGGFVAQLNAICKKYKLVTPTPTDNSEQSPLQQASKILSENVSTERSVDEQRQINKALNSLLQAYSRAKLQNN